MAYLLNMDCVNGSVTRNSRDENAQYTKLMASRINEENVVLAVIGLLPMRH